MNMPEKIRIRQWKDTKTCFVLFPETRDDWSGAGYRGHCSLFDQTGFGHGPYRRAMRESTQVRDNIPEACALVDELVDVHKIKNLEIL